MTGNWRLTIAIEDAVDETEEQRLVDAYYAHHDAFAPGRNWAPLWVVGRDGDGAAQAVLHAVTFFDWLSLSFLWVEAPYRRQGVGSRLLAQAEDVARSRGAANAYLDTFTFQAPAFYYKHGYREFGRLEMPRGHWRLWFVKRL
jgi:GNAT superfamily N-acetyltransferase